MTRNHMTWRVKNRQLLNVRVKCISLRLNKQVTKRSLSIWSLLRRDIDRRILICKEESTLRVLRMWTSLLKLRTSKTRLEWEKIRSFKTERNLMELDTPTLLSLITIQTCRQRLTLSTITLESCHCKTRTWPKNLIIS